STDKTKENAEEFKTLIPNFRFIEHLCKNVSIARNFGATKASGEYLVFLDADGEIENHFLSEIKEKIIANNLDSCTVWNRTKSTNFTARFILMLLNLSMTLFQKIKPAASGTCIIIKKEIFAKIKGFNQRTVFGEDFDLIQKAHKIHARFAVFPTPIFYTSTRRYEKEGLVLSLSKSVKALVHQIFLGPIIKPIFEYEMGGQYFKETKKK
ncbi:MAG: glycosyltransferase, partial [Actinobacteria bacterium]|nr:glycosyltransferase [Actinomycetota bacterium]